MPQEVAGSFGAGRAASERGGREGVLGVRCDGEAVSLDDQTLDDRTLAMVASAAVRLPQVAGAQWLIPRSLCPVPPRPWR
jgi:hypothetical protein